MMVPQTINSTPKITFAQYKKLCQNEAFTVWSIIIIILLEEFKQISDF